MKNTLFLLALIGLLSAGVGCRLPADPYDYCGPTYTGPCGPVDCNPSARAGSVLSPPLCGTNGGPEMIVTEGLDMSIEPSLAPIPQEEAIVSPPEVSVSRARTLPAPPRNARTSGLHYR